MDSAPLKSDLDHSTLDHSNLAFYMELNEDEDGMDSPSSSPRDNHSSLWLGSGSPRTGPTSNSTSALQSTSGNELRPTPAMNIGSGNPKGFSNGWSAPGWYYCEASSVFMDDSNRKPARRESSIASSVVAGMSWSGLAAGSWVQNELMNQGSYPRHTPSSHSSSYLPKVEAHFMRDFQCCGSVFPTHHDLMQHSEEAHDIPIPLRAPGQTSVPRPDHKAASAAGAAAAVRERAQQPPAGPFTSRPAYADSAGPAAPRHMPPSRPRAAADMPPAPALPAHENMDVVHEMDMEMDDALPADPPSPFPIRPQSHAMQSTGFGQPPSTRGPPLDRSFTTSNPLQSHPVPPLDLTSLTMSNPRQSHQGLRHSTPTTPVAGGRTANMYLPNNPTVSSVNTPTLVAHPRQQQQPPPHLNTPTSSVPGTPNGLNQEFNASYIQPSIGTNSQLVQDQYRRFGPYGFVNGADVSNPCIDDPGTRLFNRDGGFNGLEQSSIKLSDGAYSEDSELARTIREEQRLAGVPDPQLDDPDVPKPFACPVIGCEKAYRNQNGLKYHKTHGHSAQQLVANPNGTYSILNPETLVPYPGTLGMEIQKPHACSVCGKRYKNPNGLKYHKGHSPTCDTDQRQQPSPRAESSSQGMQGSL